MMTYKGYYGVVQYDDEAKIFHGEVINTRTVITFQGTTVDEIETSFRDSVDDYLDWCKERNKEPEKPFSGKFVLRLSPDLHRKLNLKAKMTNTSLNSFIVQTLEKAAVSWLRKHFNISTHRPPASRLVVSLYRVGLITHRVSLRSFGWRIPSSWAYPDAKHSHSPTQFSMSAK
jgi:predicted HicB family RNase H-like nuclease